MSNKQVILTTILCAVVGATAGAAAGAIVVVGSSTIEQIEIHQTLRTRALEVLGKDNQVVAFIDVGEDGVPRLQLEDGKDGRILLGFDYASEPGGSADLALWKGKGCISLSSSKDKVVALFTTEDLKSRKNLSKLLGGFGVQVNDNQCDLTVTAPEPSISITDGSTHASLGSVETTGERTSRKTKTPAAALSLFDKEGTLIWQAP